MEGGPQEAYDPLGPFSLVTLVGKIPQKGSNILLITQIFLGEEFIIPSTLFCCFLFLTWVWTDKFTGNTKSYYVIWTVIRENSIWSFYCLSPGKVEEQLQYGGTVYRRIFKMQGGVGKKTIPTTTCLTSVPRAEGV